MKRYYGIIDESGFLTKTGTNCRELERQAKGNEDVVNISEGVYQYAREVRDEEPLYIEELTDEWDSRINEDVYYLDLPHVTVGRLKRFIANLPDDAEICIWDTDTRALKECVGLCMNGPSIQLETETWGRSWLKH